VTGRSRWACTVEARRRLPVEQQLRIVLPPRDGNSSEARLQMLAARALAEGAKKVKPRLSQDEADDLRSHLVEVGLQSVLSYDDFRDRGAGRLRLDTRFGAYAYIRMRRGVIDWLRSNRTDSRTRRQSDVTVDPSLLSEGELAEVFLADLDFADDFVSRTEGERFRSAARKAGYSTTTEFAIDACSIVSDIVLGEVA
jgi:hypothetical protein